MRSLDRMVRVDCGAALKSELGISGMSELSEMV